MFISSSGAYVTRAIRFQKAAAGQAAIGNIEGARALSQQAGFLSSASELSFAAEKEGIRQSKKSFLD